MDIMEEWEVNDIIENIQYLDRNDWEQARLNLNTSYVLKTRKKIKTTDLLKFPWDKESAVDTAIDNESIRRLKEKSELYKKLIVKKDGK